MCDNGRPAHRPLALLAPGACRRSIRANLTRHERTTRTLRTPTYRQDLAHLSRDHTLGAKRRHAPRILRLLAGPPRPIGLYPVCLECGFGLARGTGLKNR